ncbi:MAG TPA: hypothetical protein VIL46_13970, partial [Gemmataceae bacterium]
MLGYIVHHVTVRRRVLKRVACEECGFKYAYSVERSGSGTASRMVFGDDDRATRDATYEAEAELEENLEEGVEAVPCPNCGHVQDHMIQRAKWSHHRWMVYWPCQVFIYTGASTLGLYLVHRVLRRFGFPFLESLYELGLVLTVLAAAVAGVMGVIRLCRRRNSSRTRRTSRSASGGAATWRSRPNSTAGA